MGIGITPDSKYVVVTVQFSSNAFVYNAKDGQLVGMLPLPSPGGVVVTSPWQGIRRVYDNLECNSQTLLYPGA